MSKNQVNKNRKIGALVAYTTLVCTVVSLGVYVYRQQQRKGAGGNSSSRQSNNNSNGTIDSRDRHSSLDQNGRPSLDNNSTAAGGRQDDTRSSEVIKLHLLLRKNNDDKDNHGTQPLERPHKRVDITGGCLFSFRKIVRNQNKKRVIINDRQEARRIDHTEDGGTLFFWPCCCSC